MNRPPVTAEAVESLIASGDVAGMVALFDHATDQDRAKVRDLADHSRRWQLMSSRDPGPDPRAAAVEVLFAATARAGDVALGLHRVRMAPDVLLGPVVAAIEARSERFIQTLGRRMLASSGPRRTPWCVIRKLVRDGSIDPVEIDDDAYIRALAFSHRVDLLDDRELVDREVWRLFEVSGALVLANVGSWIHRFGALAEASPMLRDRLLDAALSALAVDFSPGQLRSCIKIVDALAPTDAELSERAPVVAALCGVPSPVCPHAIGWLERIVDHGGIEPAEAVAALDPALVAQEKKVALDALRLVDRLADGDAGAHAIVPALGHTHPDVASRAAKLLDHRIAGVAPSELHAALVHHLEVVPAAVRPQLEELVARTASAPAAQPPPDVAAPLIVPRPVSVDPDPEAVWADDRRLALTDDPEQVVAIAATLLEGQGDGDDLDVLVAGLPALAGLGRGVRDIFEPLVKRAEQLRSPRRPVSSIMRSSWVADSVAQAVLDIVHQRPIRRFTSAPETVSGIAAGRLLEAVAALARGRPVEPLATSTHRGGHLHLETYLERTGRGAGLGPIDARQAALRVGWTGASPRLDVRCVEVSREGRHDQSLCPFEFVRSAPEPSDDPAVEAGLTFLTALNQRWGGRRSPQFPHYRWWPWDASAAVLDMRVSTTVLSSRPDLVAAAGLVALIDPDLDYEYRGENGPVIFEFLTDPAVPLDGPVLLLLTVGFTAPVALRAAAVDAAVTAVDQRRLDPAVWSRVAADLHVTRLMTLPRVAAAATDLASAGAPQRFVAQQFLLGLICHLSDPPSTLYAVLDALVEMGVEDLHVTAEASEALRRLATRSSRAARNARAILAAVDTRPSAR